MPKVSIITVNYNQAEVTAELLKSIQQQRFQDIEIIVVDNASRQNPFPLLERVYPNLIAVQSKENLGFAGGNNLGIQVSTGEYLFFINNDAEIVEGTIQTLLDCFKKRSNLGIVSPKLYYHLPERKTQLLQYVGATPVHPITGRNKTIGQYEEELGQYQIAKPTAFAHGAAMLVKREVIEKVGHMPEDFFLYYEELDWCEQIRRAGYEIYVEPNAVVYHKESVSVGQMSLLKTYYINRNRIFFMRRNKSLLEFTAFSMYVFLVFMPVHSLKFLLQGKLDYLKTFWNAIFWNYFDGKKESIFSEN